MGVIEGNRPATDNDWETIKSQGDTAIKRWIHEQMTGRSCLVVLIGSKTANREWINYEIIKAWSNKMGVVGVYIHKLKDNDKYDPKQSVKGANPFDYLKLGTTQLSSIVKTYDSPYSTSKNTYAYINQNLATWVEEAIQIRNRY